MQDRHNSRVLDIFWVFLRLGLTSFGGPVAHIGYFHNEFVTRRNWLSEKAYADLVALCQFLPGPASSQVGMAIGLGRGGQAGALAAWLGFTLPSAAVLTAFALGMARFGQQMPQGSLHGLNIAAVAVVAQAVWGMAVKLCPDRPRLSLMVAATCGVLLWPGALGHMAVIVLGGLAGLGLASHNGQSGPLSAGDGAGHATQSGFGVPFSRRRGAAFLALFAALLVLLPVAAQWSGGAGLSVASAFYRVGSLVFGGGHVVLPLLQAEFVPTGMVSGEAFLAGYGLAQAVPGPLFTFAAFLGASLTSPVSGVFGALLATVMVFLPSYLLVAGALPFWARLRADARMRRALAGVNAAVVGILLAALYTPVWVMGIRSPGGAALGLVCFAALQFWRVPTWLVVPAAALVGACVPL